MLLLLAPLLLLRLPYSSTSLARPGHDLILLAKCHAQCPQSSGSAEKRQCIKECEETPWKKPGECPTNGTALSLGCLNECSGDIACPGMLKCCTHNCGITCKQPENLDKAPGLPNVPRDVQVNVRRTKYAIIRWSHNVSNGVHYVLEERHHLGPQFKLSVVSQWCSLHKPPKISSPVKVMFQVGNWYQVRVAAVNINGTRGYSQPSAPFTLPITPRQPNPPTNLKWSSATNKNGSVSVVFSWDPPSSDLPITKYIVYWNKRLATKDSHPTQGAIYVQQKIVTHEKTRIRIRKLLPNVLYFLQVQAQSQFGKRPFTSERASLEFNSSSAILQNGMSEKSERTPKGKDLILKKSKLIVIDNKISTTVSWKSRSNSKYAVIWESSCGSNKYDSLVVMASYANITGLEFNCKYNVIVREKNGGKKPRRSGKLVIMTPPCTQFTPPAC